jgi:hypothetical protein
VTDGFVRPEVFVQLVREAFTAIPEPEMFAQVYDFIRNPSMVALGAGSLDTQWYTISDELGAIRREWGWPD